MRAIEKLYEKLIMLDVKKIEISLRNQEGFVNYKYQDWKRVRTLNADEYISYINTQ